METDSKTYQKPSMKAPGCLTLSGIAGHCSVRSRTSRQMPFMPTNANRKWCTERKITTNFKRKGRAGKYEDQRMAIAAELHKERATRMEGSFGTEKQHYSLDKIKARIKKNEILWIFFGVHTANAVRIA